MVELLAAQDQSIETAIEVCGTCPAAHDTILVRVAHEMIGNAIEHGLARRRAGRISIRLQACESLTRMTIADDGAALCHEPNRLGRQGCPMMEDLVSPLHGQVVLWRSGPLTYAELLLPAPQHRRAQLRPIVGQSRHLGDLQVA